MKDVYETLYRKEADLARVRQEIESLKFVASMLSDEPGAGDPTQNVDGDDKKPAESALPHPSEMEATGTEGPFSIPRQPSFWASLTGRRR
jgi:hypothetical protein